MICAFPHEHGEKVCILEEDHPPKEGTRTGHYFKHRAKLNEQQKAELEQKESQA